MATRRMRWCAAAGAVAALVAACGGEVLAALSFIGSAGGDWRVDDAAQAGFQQRQNCGPQSNDFCTINIQPIGTQDLYATDFGLSFTGTLPGCPSTSRTDGRATDTRIVLPGCFTGRYLTINEALSDDSTVRAFFDSAVPNLTTGVWVEIQDGRRRFKFTSNASVRDIVAVTGCELTSPVSTLTATVSAASINDGRLQTAITQFSVGGQNWTGAFVGLSGMRLVRGNEVMELQRRNESGAC
jgi:hypothetical protein